MVHPRDADEVWDWHAGDDGVYARPATEYVRPPLPLLITGTDSRMVVGTAFQPEPLRDRAGSRCRVELVPEPGNPYDANALAVDLNGVRIGYLSAGDAAHRQPGVRAANAAGYHVLADGKFVRIGGYLEVQLRLPHPRDLSWWLTRPEQQRTSGFRPLTRVTLRGIDHFQPQLLAVLAGRDRATLAGRLLPQPVATGKWAGAFDARVLVEETEIGALRALDLEDDVQLQRALRRGPVHCGVDLVRYPERAWGQVLIG